MNKHNQLPKSISGQQTFKIIAYTYVIILLVQFNIVNGQNHPFTVKENLFNQANTQTLDLEKAPGTVTNTVFSPTISGDHYSNAVAVIGFKGYLYCQWQSSATDEDSEDTWVAYSRSQNGQTWTSPMVLAESSSDGYRASGGWWVNGDTLVAYINHWPASVVPRGGYTEYRTSTDGLNWTSIKRVKMANGSDLNGIFEQDPHALPDGRIINAAHFQPGLTVSPIYTDDPSGIRGWVRANYTNLPYSGAVTREIEPSSYRRDDGNIVMVFRDQNSSYKRLASMSSDRGQTWSTTVETNMPDSRSKQSAGNLPDGTAYLVGNPVNTNRRYPLAIALSADGKTFDKAYLLRNGGSELPTLKYAGKAKTLGYSYPKSTIWEDYLYVGYSVNKEDVLVTRIPLSALNMVCTKGFIDNCTICSGGTTGLKPCSGFMEAENACSVDGIPLEDKNTGFSGLGYVNADNAIGAGAIWSINSSSAQTATLAFRYANAGTTSRDGDLYVNGTKVTNIKLPSTGSWTTWNMASLTIPLANGVNEIALKATTADGLANIDLISFSEGVSEGICIITGNLSASTTELSIHPNPTHNRVFWNTEKDWILSDIQGKELAKGKGSSTDLSSFPNGIYFIKIDQTVTKVLKR